MCEEFNSIRKSRARTREKTIRVNCENAPVAYRGQLIPA